MTDELIVSTIGSQHLTLADQVATELHWLILSGEFPGGSSLPINKLAERFGTSPMPVRDALRRLAGIGVVEIIPHRGARVLEFSLEDLTDTYEVRAELEGMAIAQAATLIDDEALNRARSALERHVTALEGRRFDEAREAHTEFHFALYEACGSYWLMRAIKPVWQNSERYRFAAASGDHNLGRSHQEHLEILEACAEHDPEAAAHALKAHILGAMNRISSDVPSAG